MITQRICLPCADKLIDCIEFRYLILESYKQLIDRVITDNVASPVEENIHFQCNFDTDNEYSDGLMVTETLRVSPLPSSLPTSFERSNVTDIVDSTAQTHTARLICDMCNRSYGRRSSFLKHYRYVHLKDLYRSKYKCPLCPRTFSATGEKNSIEMHV